MWNICYGSMFGSIWHGDFNYSQKNFYERTGIPYTAYTPEIFNEFVDNYISKTERIVCTGQSDR